MNKNLSLILKNANFVKLWVSQFTSLFVVSLLNFALIVRIFEGTQSSTAIAVFWLIYSLPTVFLGLFAGVLVDYWSKRKVLLWTNIFQALVALLYLPLGKNVWPIYGVVFLYSLIDEFFRPAQEASLPNFVKKERLPFANSLMVISLQGAGIAGYTLAGPLMQRAPEHFIFFFGSILLLLGALAAALLPVDRPANHKKPLGNGFGGFLDDLKEGYQVIRRERKIWTSILLMGIIGATTTLVIALAPAISREIFATDLRDFGIMMIPAVSLGAILTSVAIDRLLRVFSCQGLTRIGFAVLGLICIFLPLLGLSATTNRVFIVLIALLIGFALIVTNTSPKTLIQENTPLDSRGRVFGTLRTLITFASSIPMLLGAVLADLVGLRPVMVFAGIGVLVGSFYLLRREDGI